MEDNKRQGQKANKNSDNKPNFPKMNNNRNRSGFVMYVIYIAIILVLGFFMITGESDSPQNINSVKFCQILENQDCEKIVVINGEFAEVYIKSSSIKNDSAYNDLRDKNEMGKPRVAQNFYIYKFATLEALNSEITDARNMIIQRDTTDKGLSAEEKRDIISNTRFNQEAEKRTDVWSGVLSLLWPILIIVLFFVIMIYIFVPEVIAKF